MKIRRDGFCRIYAGAFTLIELLVVIGIIGTMAAFLGTGIGKSKSSAQSALCRNNLRQLGTSLEMFVSENQRYPVNGAQTKPITPANSDRFWLGQLAREGLGVPRPATNFYREGVWRCPSARWSSEMLSSSFTQFADYGYNDDKFSGGGPKEWTNKFGLQGHYNPETSLYTPITEPEVVVPSEMMAIGDCFEGNAIFMRKSVNAYQGFGNIRTRHSGRGNVVFCDGHIQAPALEFLFEDMSEAALSRWNRDHVAHQK